MYSLIFFHGRWLAEDIYSCEGPLTPVSIKHINRVIMDEDPIVLSPTLEQAATLLKVDIRDILVVTRANEIKE
jgi:hypothetical protein